MTVGITEEEVPGSRGDNPTWLYERCDIAWSMVIFGKVPSNGPCQRGFDLWPGKQPIERKNYGHIVVWYTICLYVYWYYSIHIFFKTIYATCRMYPKVGGNHGFESLTRNSWPFSVLTNWASLNGVRTVPPRKIHVRTKTIIHHFTSRVSLHDGKGGTLYIYIYTLIQGMGNIRASANFFFWMILPPMKLDIPCIFEIITEFGWKNTVALSCRIVL